ncbi:MAG: MerR family transcriptional regulator [Oscillospiraceae bacterium]
MYRIGEFSKMSKTTIKALRYYDEIGLLNPEGIDQFTGYRFYTTNQLVELHNIQSLRQIGLSIDEIKLILSGSNAQTILKKRKAELVAELQNGQDQLSRIEFILLGKQEEQFMNYKATIKELPECIVFSKKMTVPNYDAYFEVIPAIGEQVTKHYPDLKCSVPEYCFIRYLDGEYKEKDIRVEFCEAVDKMRDDFEDIHFQQIETITAVSVMHKGGYAELSQAYAFAFQWIESNGYTVIESPRENYIDGIWNKEEQEDWLTELQIPALKK